MTNTALATIPTNAVDINKAFGFESSKMKPEIPVLKINGADEEDGTAPKGTFTYDTGEGIVYANDVVIRTFLKGIQYRRWDAKDKSKNDMSIIANSFRAEFRSTSGKLACGKMSSKKYAEMGSLASPTQQELQKEVKCKLILFGLVSGKFTSVDTKEEVVLEDQLFIWATPQSAFMPLDQVISGVEKERRAIPCTKIKLKLKKEKQGSVTYFVPQAEVLNDIVELSLERDIPNLDKIKKFVSDTNAHVEAKYNEALKAKALDGNFANVGEILEGKKSEYTGDEIPF